MRIAATLTAAAVAAAVAVRVAHSRDRRFLHPDGRSFTGDLEIWGGLEPTGAALLDRPGRHPVTLRISKGIGTRPGRPDVLGVAVRVHGPVAGRRHDLLFSTAGRGRVLRHVPVLRSGFDTVYGSILPYRSGTGRTFHLAVQADPDGGPLGRTLESVVAAARHDNGRLLLALADGDAVEVVGRLRFGAALSDGQDAALAFDPVRNVTDDLHPTGLVHGSRAAAYRLSQRWRGARPAAPNPAAVARTNLHG
ncbi:hypothetical protein GCM10020358_01090 [Amorphoplanes nipponensis]|uniref:Phosphodiesterase n=1 Tax=Actinoplanes nipponensis TaxID=135950 RepID=A0A919JCF3_9ACTN|nr:hypothetical protein [Actinoplanes nipponensis]GIE48178.1 hypothetical protein Ani05nite_17120 [Actinoplanes nipponensis]